MVVDSFLLLLLALMPEARLSLFEIFLLSLFPFLLTIYDRTPFYGSSLIVFFLSTRLVLKSRLIEDVAIFSIKVPRLLVISLFLFSVQGLNAPISIGYAHLWAVLLSFCLDFRPRELFSSLRLRKTEK